MSGIKAISGFKAFSFKVLIDQEQPRRLLTTILRKGTLPHALLFTGIEGVGKLTAAITYAMVCNCVNNGPEYVSKNGKSDDIQDLPYATEPCGRCQSCKKILSGNHPDIILTEPSGALIKIGQIRALCNTLSMRPYEARTRVVVINHAQTMNPEAGNALLKMLEEPPGGTIFVLTALQLSDLLPTIVSRCQHIRFNPVSQEGIETFLVGKHGIDHDEAKILAAMADGSLSKAERMTKGLGNQRNWIKMRNWLIDEVDSLSSKPIGSSLALAEKLSKKKEEIVESLKVITIWLRDLVIHKYNPGKIINGDLVDKIQLASQRFSVLSLLSKIEAVRFAQKSIDSNANLRLALEVLMMRLAK